MGKTKRVVKVDMSRPTTERFIKLTMFTHCENFCLLLTRWTLMKYSKSSPTRMRNCDHCSGSRRKSAHILYGDQPHLRREKLKATFSAGIETAHLHARRPRAHAGGRPIGAAVDPPGEMPPIRGRTGRWRSTVP